MYLVKYLGYYLSVGSLRITNTLASGVTDFRIGASITLGSCSLLFCGSAFK